MVRVKIQRLKARLKSVFRIKACQISSPRTHCNHNLHDLEQKIKTCTATENNNLHELQKLYIGIAYIVIFQLIKRICWHFLLALYALFVFCSSCFSLVCVCCNYTLSQTAVSQHSKKERRTMCKQVLGVQRKRITGFKIVREGCV